MALKSDLDNKLEKRDYSRERNAWKTWINVETTSKNYKR